jgi:hypothetical protein
MEAVTDELFEVVVYIRFASKLKKESSIQFTRVQSYGMWKNTVFRCGVLIGEKGS